VWKFSSRTGLPTENARAIAVRFKEMKLNELNEMN
jgi:hypothetical protein